MEKAQDSADPNQNGVVVLKQLDVVASRLYGLQLIIPGALGRSILADNRLRWIATTEAVILKYHDMAYTIHVLCSLFLARTKIPYDGSQLIYSTRLQPVVTKMVNSIGLHVNQHGQRSGTSSRFSKSPSEVLLDTTDICGICSGYLDNFIFQHTCANRMLRGRPPQLGLSPLDWHTLSE